MAILFVCLGNICRSPLVEAVARKQCAQAGLNVTLASCGTGGWHVGQGADPRMRRAAAVAGYDLSSHRARQLCRQDFSAYHWVLAMDGDNLSVIEQQRAAGSALAALFLPWAGVDAPKEFPDPYLGSEEGFHAAVALAERGVAGLVVRLRGG